MKMVSIFSGGYGIIEIVLEEMQYKSFLKEFLKETLIIN